MSTLKLVATLDKKGSEGLPLNHYTFGKPGADVSGGPYIKKSATTPDFIELELKDRKEF